MIEHGFDYIYIFSIGITSIFKLSFYQSLINSKKKYKFIISTIIMILAIGAYYVYKKYSFYIWGNDFFSSHPRGTVALDFSF